MNETMIHKLLFIHLHLQTLAREIVMLPGRLVVRLITKVANECEVSYDNQYAYNKRGEKLLAQSPGTATLLGSPLTVATNQQPPQ